jgi:hypothetical protein
VAWRAAGLERVGNRWRTLKELEEVAGEGEEAAPFERLSCFTNRWSGEWKLSCAIR